MLNTILLDATALLIPIVAISFSLSIPIIGIILHFRQKGREMDERKLMIEKGITPPPLLSEDQPRSKGASTVKGLNLLAIALGLLIGYVMTDYIGMPRIFSLIAFVLLFLGLANLISVMINQKNEKNEDER